MKQKRDKIINEKSEGSKILIGIIAFVLFFGIIIVSALTTEEALQNELDNLIQQVNDAGYSWLINQSINYSEIDSLIMGSGGFI